MLFKFFTKKTTHCDLLPLIANNMPLDCIIDCRYISFYNSISTSSNNIVRFIAKYRLFDCKSTMGKNMTHLMHKYDLINYNLVSLSKKCIKEHCYSNWIYNINEEYPIFAQMITELITMKEGRSYRSLSNEDCNIFIEYLCNI